jgi:uncharacterized protein (TIGR04255 family)
MNKIEKLNSPPISECLFDIRVKAQNEFDVSTFKNIEKDIAHLFNSYKERMKSEFNIKIDKDQISTEPLQKIGLQGIFYRSPDDTLISQFRIDGFTLNKLEPYTSYNELFPVFLELWEKYVDVASPVAITRVGLRYLNRFKIEKPEIDFDDYLNYRAQLPPELPQFIESYNEKITLVDEKNLNKAHINISFENVIDPFGVQINLDIDAFRNVDLDPKSEELDNIFHSLRELKNLIFFSTLTEKSLEIFK